MVRKSNEIAGRERLLAELGQAVPAFQDATDEVDEAAGVVLGLNRTDLRTLGVLLRRSRATAGELAKATGLTRGAMTTVLDRLEGAGYVRRAHDAKDRRSVRVEVTEVVFQRVEAIWGPLRDEGFRHLAGVKTSELAAILRFLEYGRRLQLEHAARIRSLPKPRPARGGRPKPPSRSPRAPLGER